MAPDGSGKWPCMTPQTSPSRCGGRAVWHRGEFAGNHLDGFLFLTRHFSSYWRKKKSMFFILLALEFSVCKAMHSPSVRALHARERALYRKSCLVTRWYWILANPSTLGILKGTFVIWESGGWGFIGNSWSWEQMEGLRDWIIFD